MEKTFTTTTRDPVTGALEQQQVIDNFLVGFPARDEVVTRSVNESIDWSGASYTAGTVTIEISFDSGLTYQVLVADAPNIGDWPDPGPQWDCTTYLVTEGAYLRITMNDFPNQPVQSSQFSIV